MQSNKRNIRKKSAFSLIELSIVLIIIGLLVAGVTGGASLIKSSELRSVIGEARAWAVSVNGFYNQFGYLPGDYSTAIGSASVGDADSKIEYLNESTIAEGRAAWFQMKGAGVVDSTVISSAPVATTSVAGSVVFGSQVPSSKIKSSGWDFDYNTTSLQNVVVLTGTISAAGTVANTLVNGTVTSTGAITPTDALSIDSKVDDGKANTGKIRGVGATIAGATKCYDSVSGAYATENGGKNCAISYQVDVNS